jgi:hypothetical protein
MTARGFYPFFDRAAEWFPAPVVAKGAVALLLGIGFVPAGFPFLGALIGCGMAALYYGTHTFRGMFPHLDLWSEPEGGEIYRKTVGRVLRDRNFVAAGVFFGIVNTWMGREFGVPKDVANQAIDFGGFFVVGFVCGMAVWGILGVAATVHSFTASGKVRFDYTDPDHCGGMGFLGEALLKFGAVTLIEGVLIWLYIRHTKWDHLNVGPVAALGLFWAAFPFLLSLIVWLLPAQMVSRALEDYKVREEGLLQSRLSELRKRIENPALPALDRDEARKEYDYRVALRAELYRMQTSPFSLLAAAKYAAVFLVHGAAAVSELKGVFGKVLG